MSQFRLFAPLLAAALVAGCTGTPGTPETSPSPATSPAAGGNNPVTGNVGVGGAAFFTAGKMWEYNLSTTAAGQTTSGTMKMEVSEVQGDLATLKVTSTIAGNTVTNSSQVKVNEPNGFASAQSQGDVTPTKAGMESVTVPAGTFQAEKWTYAQNDENGEGTGTYWIAEGVGMVKQMQTVKPKTTVPGFDLTNTTTLELKSYK